MGKKEVLVGLEGGDWWEQHLGLPNAGVSIPLHKGMLGNGGSTSLTLQT